MSGIPPVLPMGSDLPTDPVRAQAQHVASKVLPGVFTPYDKKDKPFIKAVGLTPDKFTENIESIRKQFRELLKEQGELLLKAQEHGVTRAFLSTGEKLNITQTQIVQDVKRNSARMELLFTEIVSVFKSDAIDWAKEGETNE